MQLTGGKLMQFIELVQSTRHIKVEFEKGSWDCNKSKEKLVSSNQLEIAMYT